MRSEVFEKEVQVRKGNREEAQLPQAGMAWTSLQRSGEGVWGIKSGGVRGCGCRPFGSPRSKVCQRQAFQALPKAALLIPYLPRDILQALTQPSAPAPDRREAGSS